MKTVRGTPLGHNYFGEVALLHRFLAFVGALLCAVASTGAAAQCVSLTTLGSAYTQNFDTLSNTAGSTTNNLTITGWFLTEGGAGARDNEQYAVDTGASNTGDTFSYGAAGSTERALGQLRSGSLIPLFGACFTNNTGSTITSLAIAYTGEEWRLGTAARTDQMNFEYSLNATDLVTGTWTNVAALNFVTPNTATTGAKDGNAAANRTALSSTISSLSVANGATFWIRWNDTDASGADDGLAVDDFSLTPSAAAAVNLTINDVSLNEGNAGTTSFTFTVSLSAPAGPGGVTFDIATADGTATQPSDYTQKSLTSQTIPAGSSTYSFTVLVNGDTTPETNETFFVNVTNVTGATVTDGQGQGVIVNDDAAPNLTINDVSLSEGNAGTTTFTFTVSLSAPAPTGGVTFDIATADGTATAPGDYTAKSLTSQTIPAGSSTYTFDVLVNGDIAPETDETFFVNITNITNAIGTDTQGQGTIVNDDITRIHDVQGNGATSPLVGATVTVEGIVIGNYQGTTKLRGFFLQEEDSDADADPNTSEGIFIFCNTCPTAVAEGQRVRATGVVSEFNGMTEITASTAGSVVVTNAGNNLAQVTPTVITLPIAGDINAFYEAREGMRVTFSNTLTVSEYFELARYGTIELYEGGRPMQFTETNAPSVAGNTAYADTLARRRVIVDDDNDTENVSTTQTDGQQFIYHPRANGGFSVGTQGTDFFRGGDLVNGLTGVLHWSFSGGTSPSAWRVRPTAANPVTFTVANPRPATPPAVGGAIKAVSMNMLNYFTTIDTTSSNSTGPCGPGGTLDCRGADSVAELIRQRDRASIVICSLNADVYALMEMENTTPSATVTDLLGAVNTRCGGVHPFAFINTGGTLGTDAIRINLIYRTGIVSPVGAPLVDLDPIHSRPPTAQTFDVVDATNAAFGKRFTVIGNHLKSKGSSAGLPGDTDIGDGQGASAETRTAQATRLLTWVSSTVVPAAGDPKVLLLGDFNSYAMEPPITTITGGGYTDLASTLLGPGTYSYLFDGQLGHLDYAFASASLTPQVTGVGIWHINADEVDLFDYNDEVRDSPGEATFEEKPDGSALTPPRVMFAPATPYRASDHDPVIVGLFQVADLAITKVDTPDPVTAGNNLTYTITVTNNGPDAAASASWSDTLPAGTTFVSMPTVAGWSCATPTVGLGGTVSCTQASFAVGSSVFTLTVNVGAAVASGTVLSNTATVTSTTGDSNAGNNSATATTTVATSADLSVAVTDSPDPVQAGSNLTYTITVANAGPSVAASVTLADTLPVGTTFVSLSSPGGWSCTTPAVGASGSINCTATSLSAGSGVFTLVVNVGLAVPNGTVLSNTATVSSSTTDSNAGNNSATATTTVTASADLSVTMTDSPDPVGAGNTITYTITVANAGPTVAASAAMTDTLPAGTTFASLVTPAGWSCTNPAVGSGGTINCSTIGTLPVGSSVFTLVVTVAPATAAGTVISNTATVTSPTADPNSGNNSATASTTVVVASMSPAFTLVPTAVAPGQAFTGLTLVCTNTGGSVATNPTCVPSANLGTVSAVSCSPASPATLAAGATITCSFNYTAPGSAGGGDDSNTAIVFTGATSAANANSGAVSSATATALVIDAVNDGPTTVQNNVANVVNLLVNDTVGAVAASTAGMGNATVTANGAVSCVGCAGTPTALTIAADGTVTVPASAVAGTYSVPYQICATPANAAPLAAACDNAVATIVVQGADMVSRITCTPTSAGPGTTVTCTATCTNNGPAPAVNAVCTILNVASLPAGASVPVCTGSPAASLAAGATLTCTVTFPMPAQSSITVAAGAAADNDVLGGSDPAAVINNASSVSFGALLAVPGLGGLALALLGLLLAGIAFLRGSRDRRRQ